MGRHLRAMALCVGGWPAAHLGHATAAEVAAPSSQPPPSGLTVSNVQRTDLVRILGGDFTLQVGDGGVNHGRPVYKKDTLVDGVWTVMIYYWDDRDGAANNGWWIGQSVGGDQVWGFNAVHDACPPASGWRVPFDGPLDTLTVSPKTGLEAQQVVNGAVQPLQGQQHLLQQPQAAPPQLQARPMQQLQHTQLMQLQQLQHAAQAQHIQQAAAVLQWQAAAQQQHQQHAAAAQQQHQAAALAIQRQQDHQLRLQQHQQHKEAAQQAALQAVERKKNEEEERRKHLEDRRKQMEEMRLRVANEQKATQAILKVLQRVRVATPETFDFLKKELDEVAEQELKLVSEAQREKLQGEITKAIELATKCVEKITHQRKLLEERRLAEEKRKKEENDKVEAVLTELAQSVANAEKIAASLVAAATEIGASLTPIETPIEAATTEAAGGNPTPPPPPKPMPPRETLPEKAAAPEAPETSTAPETLPETSIAPTTSPSSPSRPAKVPHIGMDGLREASQLLSNLTAADDTLSTKLQAAECAVVEANITNQACRRMLIAISHMMRTLPYGWPQKEAADQNVARLEELLSELSNWAKAAKLKAMSERQRVQPREDARHITKELHSVFDRYDKDMDGALSRQEARSFAKGEFGFVVPEDVLDDIWRKMVDTSAGDCVTPASGRGIPLAGLVQLKTHVGVAREVGRARARKAEREREDAVYKEKEDELKEQLGALQVSVEAAELALRRAEEQVPHGVRRAPLPRNFVVGTRQRAATIEEMLASAESIDDSVDEARSAFDDVMKQRRILIEEEFGEAGRMRNRAEAFLRKEAKALDLHLGRMDLRLTRASNLTCRHRYKIIGTQLAEIEILRDHAQNIVRHNHSGSRSGATRRLEAIFKKFDTKGDGLIDVDEFVSYFERADKVVTACFMEEQKTDAHWESGFFDASNGNSSTSAPRYKVVQRAETYVLPGEDLRHLFARLDEEGQGLIAKDDFLHLFQRSMKVAVSTPITVLLDVVEAEAETLRRLEPGEVVEVIDGPAEQASVGALRAHVRACSDGLEGWATVAGNAGTKFLVEGGNVLRVTGRPVFPDSGDDAGLLLTAGLADMGEDEAAERVTRRLAAGSVVAAIHPSRRDESSGLMRIRVRIIEDGEVGWVTLANCHGDLMLEAV